MCEDGEAKDEVWKKLRKNEKRDSSRDCDHCYWTKLIIQTMESRQESLSREATATMEMRGHNDEQYTAHNSNAQSRLQ